MDSNQCSVRSIVAYERPLDSNQVSLRFACSVRFAIVALLRCRLHGLLLTTLPPRFICHRGMIREVPQWGIRL